MRVRNLILLCITVLPTIAGCGTQARENTFTTDRETLPGTSEINSAKKEAELAWFGRRLSDAEMAGQLVMTDIQGVTTLTPDVRKQLVASHIGNIILFGFNYRSDSQLRKLNADLQAMGSGNKDAHIGLLIAIDQEGGSQRRLKSVPPELSQPRVGRGNLDDAKQHGAETGQALLALGINMNLAPVADLDVPPKHTMGSRSFGSDPEHVSDVIAATVRGQSKTIASTVKHFPGFGGATANSDDGLARVYRSRDLIEESDIAPFKSAIDEGVESVMLSHGIYRSWGTSTPASLSPVFYSYLRDELGFKGIAITDSLNAKGLHQASTTTTPQNCAIAIASGADIALVTGSLETARLCQRRILDGIRSGAISRARLREALDHVVAIKRAENLVPT